MRIQWHKYITHCDVAQQVAKAFFIFLKSFFLSVFQIGESLLICLLSSLFWYLAHLLNLLFLYCLFLFWNFHCLFSYTVLRNSVFPLSSFSLWSIVLSAALKYLIILTFLSFWNCHVLIAFLSKTISHFLSLSMSCILDCILNTMWDYGLKSTEDVDVFFWMQIPILVGFIP